MLSKNSAVSGWFFSRVNKKYSYTCFFAVSQKGNAVQLDVGTQSNYTTGHPPFSPRRLHQPLYFGKIPGNIIAALFFFCVYLLVFFFLSKANVLFMLAVLYHSSLFQKP